MGVGPPSYRSIDTSADEKVGSCPPALKLRRIKEVGSPKKLKMILQHKKNNQKSQAESLKQFNPGQRPEKAEHEGDAASAI